jgi:uracil-DNA glycosylase
MKIALVGEAWSDEEERQRMPFVGPAGFQLNSLLRDAGINRADCFLTSVFNLHPKNNNIETLCTTKALGASHLPALTKAKYLNRAFLPELERLKSELIRERPNVIVALGNVPSWALLHNTGIAKIRGTVSHCVLIPGAKVIPTYHPMAVIRQYELRPVTVMDLIKAKRESEFPEVRRPERVVYVEPTIEDLTWFFDYHIKSCHLLSVDIETLGNQITCIGFATSPTRSIVVPFLDWRRPGNSYWSTHEAEVAALNWVRMVLATSIPKLFHNCLYDVTFLWRHYGIPTNNLAEDSMLLSHARQPESLKGLGYLGSIYSNEASWKLFNAKSKTIKRDN